MTLNPSGLCMCGCGQPAPIATGTDSRRGWVKGQPVKFIRGHIHRREPIWTIDGDTGCWLWGGYIDASTGYGKHGKRWAHRAVYEMHRGPIPEGLQLDHLCRTRACVNPEHLEPVTLRENVLRGTAPAALNAAKTHCAAGHPFTGANLIVRANGSRGCRTCENAQQRERYWRDPEAMRDRQRRIHAARGTS
jgi:hypothetical protein